ncbi:MAG: Flp pilus assembly protein CpaB [Limimaricola soesokkakensis]
MMLRAGILTLALVAGGGAAWMATGMSGGTPVVTEMGAAPLKPQRQEVLVAASDVASGTMLEGGSLRWQPWPQEALNEAFILRNAQPDATETLAGMVARNGLVAGEPVLESKLSAGDASVLSSMLDSGRRAVAVRISAENTAGGLILPHDRVDVLVTTTRQEDGGQNEASSRAILRNVRVLAIDQTVESASGSVVGKTATLDLKPEEVELVTAAEASGAISLALRSLADNGETSVAEIKPSSTVRVFRAGQEQTIEIN